ncbi:MAG TPA: DUF1559 domain-containing protein [Haliangiales bacterium]|nr:DUF1559 domain-containing protein [Haliangiales bacterium]
MKGFTLIELMVVIAMVALLAALLLPALSRAKAAARSAACKSNLHQIGIALRMYVDDFRKYPLHVVYSASPFNDPGAPQKGWAWALEPYVPVQQKIFLCPENDNPPLRVISAASGLESSLPARGRYGYNAFGTALNHPELTLGLGNGWQSGSDIVVMEVGESAVMEPADMIAFGDAKGPLGIVISPILASGLIPSTRHNEGSNILYCDGHVEYQKQKILIKETDPARQRWNNDHEPHPETW